MKKANALRGWRSPEEKPVEKAVLLIAFRDKATGIVFTSQQYLGLDHALLYDTYEVLGWQYSPIWDEK